jgi:hypothetical protein
MGSYSESEKASQHREMPSTAVARRCTSAIRARPAFVLGPVDSPPWNRQRRLPGTTLMIHGAPALVLAQHRGRNLRFKGSPLQATLEHLATPMPFLTGSFRACASGSRTANNGVHQLSLRARKIM